MSLAIYLDDCSDHNHLVHSFTQARHFVGHFCESGRRREQIYPSLTSIAEMVTRTAIRVGLRCAHIAKFQVIAAKLV